MNLPDALDPADVTMLLGQPDTDSWMGRRNRLALLLMVRCGLRVSEVCQLRLDRLSVSDSGVRLRLNRTKNRKPRNVPCPPSVADAIRDWIRDDLPAGSTFLLPTRKGGPMDRRNVWAWVKKTADDAGLDPALVWPHKFRHTAITDWLEAGFELHECQAMAGHSDMSITGRYLHVRNSRVEAKMKEWKI